MPLTAQRENCFMKKTSSVMVHWGFPTIYHAKKKQKKEIIAKKIIPARVPLTRTYNLHSNAVHAVSTEVPSKRVMSSPFLISESCFGDRMSYHQMLYYVAISVADPWHFGTGTDPDPAIFVIDLQDANKKLSFKKSFLLITVLFECTLGYSDYDGFLENYKGSRVYRCKKLF